MAVSFVNGYLCTCSCDVAKAKHGVDPHQQTDGVSSDPKTQTKNGVVTDKPAVTFGGSLSDTATSTAPATAAVVTPPSPSQPGASVNLLV